MKFRIQLMVDVTLTVSEVWPDGNAPSDPTPEDVLDVIHDSCVTAGNLIDDWNLADLDEVEVEEVS